MPQNCVFTFFLQNVSYDYTKPIKITSKIIFLSRQINLNTWNLQIIPYNQEKMQIKHDALFL